MLKIRVSIEKQGENGRQKKERGKGKGQPPNQTLLHEPENQCLLATTYLGMASKFMFDWMCTLWATESMPLKGSAICQSKFLKSC